MITPFDKALALRTSLPLKAKEPFWTFQGRMRHPRAILTMLEKNGAPSAVLFEARRWYVVALCAAYEVYWRSFVKVTLDTSSLKLADLGSLRKNKFSFEDLRSIFGHQLTLSELVAAAYIFQGTDVVNQVAREVFNLDLFGALADKKYRITIEVGGNRKGKFESKSTVVRKGQDVLRFRPLIDKAFSIRHETVHDTGSRFRLSSAKAAAISSAMFEFNVLVSLCWESILNRNNSFSKKKKEMLGKL